MKGKKESTDGRLLIYDNLIFVWTHVDEKIETLNPWKAEAAMRRTVDSCTNLKTPKQFWILKSCLQWDQIIILFCNKDISLDLIR